VHVTHELERQRLLARQTQLAGVLVGGGQFAASLVAPSLQPQHVAPRDGRAAQADARVHLLEQAHGGVQFHHGALEAALLVTGDAQVQAVAAHVLQHAQARVQFVRPAPPPFGLGVARGPELDDAQQVRRARRLEIATQDAEQGERRLGVLARGLGLAQVRAGHAAQVQERGRSPRWASIQAVASPTTRA
jgi:hypothetical protein